MTTASASLESLRDDERTNAVVNNTMDELAWLRKQLDGDRDDVVREMVREFAQRLMAAEVDALTGRDVKTLARWSDATLAELRGQLLTDQFDGHVVIAAVVKSRRVTSVEVLRYEKTDDQLSSGRNIGYTNPDPGPSLPLVLFGFPRDWRPMTIRFAIAFMDEDYPSQVWALVAHTVMDVGFGNERTELEIADGMARCRIESPRRDQLYGVWWEW